MENSKFYFDVETQKYIHMFIKPWWLINHVVAMRKSPIQWDTFDFSYIISSSYYYSLWERRSNLRFGLIRKGRLELKGCLGERAMMHYN